MSERRIGIVGAGAAGYFAAINCAEMDPEAEVFLFEQSRKPLSKVAISGGGRCNVTHACFDPKELVNHYPRGSKELLGPFHVWQPADTMEWFEERGVPLKIEEDGRVFPCSDKSSSIIDCLNRSASEAGVQVKLQEGVASASRGPSGKFEIGTSTNSCYEMDFLILATGGGRQSGGYKIASDLGHAITAIQPSLFSFHIDDPLVSGLQGLSVSTVTAAHRPSKQEQSGPILITHNGLSGPAILKLSAWGAKTFYECDYRFSIEINWLGRTTSDQSLEQLSNMKSLSSKRLLSSENPFGLPKRLWERAIDLVGIGLRTQWAHVTNAQLQDLSEMLTRKTLQVSGKSMNKEEFVTCGGVALEEVNFKTMESKLTPGLYFAGEILDIDGVTGGFNFQSAWTTAMICSKSVTIK